MPWPRSGGRAPIRMRIGLHSGPAWSAISCAPGRVNFTGVETTVNVANRVEQLGKEFMQDRRKMSCCNGEAGDTLAAVKDHESLDLHLPRARASSDQGSRRAGPRSIGLV